jgi:N-methylhydantoinase B
MVTNDTTDEHEGTNVWEDFQHGYVPDEELDIHPSLSLHDKAETDIDPITYEVLRHRLWTINQDHGQTIENVSGSPVAYYGGDFQPAVLKEDGEVVFNGPYVQLFSPVAELQVKWILENRSDNPGIEPGDIFISNDPWVGATHQPDVFFVAPVFHDGDLFCWLTNTLHQYDIGGQNAGSFCPGADDVFDEPTPIPPVKAVEGGEVRQDIREMYLRHSRLPNMVGLDFNAQVAGLQVTRQNIKELIDEYGAQLVKGSLEKIIDDSESKFLDKLDPVPDGTWRTRTYEEGSQIGDGDLYEVTLQLEKKGDRLTFRNEGTDENVGAINLTYAGFRTSISCAVNPMMMYDQLWVHSGAYRHIDIETEPGTISRASHPSGVSCGANLAAILQISLIYDVMTRMLITSDETREDMILDPVSGISVLSQAGMDQWGNPFGTMNMDVMGVPWGARSTRDGMDVAGYVYSPRGPLPNVEQNEQDYPMLYMYRYNATDYGGAGENRGGASMQTAWKPHNTQAIQTVVAGSGGVKPNTSPMAAYPGAPGSLRMVENADFDSHVEDQEMPTSLDDFDQDFDEYHTKSEFLQAEPDVVETQSPGAGGYGDPLHRDPEKVLADVVKEVVSEESARKYYGVVFDEDEDGDLVVDEAGTEQRRENIVEDRLAESTIPAEEGE